MAQINNSDLSAAQLNANRRNAQHSTGPKSPEGKARSSQNALKHGFRSSRVVLSNESQERYDSLLANYIAAFRPAGQPEYDLVVRMVNAAWRLRRTWDMATALIDAEYAIIRTAVESAFSYVSPAHRAAEAIMSISAGNNPGLDQLRNHEAHFDRIWHRALNSLIKLQTLRLGRKPVYEYTPESIEPDECQSNFEEPEQFAFSLEFQRPQELPLHPRWPLEEDRKSPVQPDRNPKAA